MIVIKLNREVLNEVYVPHLEDYSKRIEIYYGGAGSGKSVFVAQKLIFKALNDKRKVLCLRKVGRTVKNSIFQLLLEQLQFFKILSYCVVNKTDYTITLPNGSVFLCSGLDDSEKIKSIVGITDIWLEEATEFIADDFHQVNLRLRHPSAANQQIYLSLNPVSKVNQVYLTFFSTGTIDEEIKKFRNDCMILKTTWKDNRFLPEEYINALLQLKSTNPVYYKIYALGEFGSLNKLVYTNQEIKDFNHAEIKGKLLCGLDFGYVNDTTAFIASLLEEETRTIYIFDEWGDTGLLNNQIAKRIMEKGFAKSIIIADSAEQKSIDEIKLNGINRIKPAVKGQGSILQGIQKLQQYKLVVKPSCGKVIEELNNYSWKKDRQSNEYINEPEDRNNHFLDALRYSLQCYEEKSKLKTIDKKIFF